MVLNIDWTDDSDAQQSNWPVAPGFGCEVPEGDAATCDDGTSSGADGDGGSTGVIDTGQWHIL
jgi:hypothetical protein